jgi:hypothetical protein
MDYNLILKFFFLNKLYKHRLPDMSNEGTERDGVRYLSNEISLDEMLSTQEQRSRLRGEDSTG